MFVSGFKTIFDLFEMIIDSFSSLFTFLTVPVGQLSSSVDSWLADLLSKALSGLGLGDFSIITLMLGAGLPVFIVYTIVKWLV